MSEQSEQVYISSETATNVKSLPKVYPFESLKVGYSFFVNFDSVEEASFRALVSFKAKKMKRSFKCIKHLEHKIYEVCEQPPMGEIKFEIHESSPKAKAYVEVTKPNFAKLKKGCSFVIPFEFATEEILTFNTKLYAMIRHEDMGVVEIFRIKKDIVEHSITQSSPAANGGENET